MIVNPIDFCFVFSALHHVYSQQVCLCDNVNMSELKALFCVVLVSFICVFPDGGFSKKVTETDSDRYALEIPRLAPRPDMVPPYYVSFQSV